MIQQFKHKLTITGRHFIQTTKQNPFQETTYLHSNGFGTNLYQTMEL